MTDWVRLWHDMPTDPKWRVIARKSGQSIPLAISIYNFALVNASQNKREKGVMSGFDCESIAEALDVTVEDISAVIETMQGRALAGDRVLDRRAMDFSRAERPPASEWRVIRERIFERDDYTCTYCGSRGQRLECDHIVPVSRGGGHHDGNLTTACFPCNRAKRNKMPSEFIQ